MAQTRFLNVTGYRLFDRSIPEQREELAKVTEIYKNMTEIYTKRKEFRRQWNALPHNTKLLKRPVGDNLKAHHWKIGAIKWGYNNEI